MWKLASVLGCLVICSGCAASGQHGFFPDAVVSAGAEYSFPAKFGEPRFWLPGSLRGNRLRLRMFIGGHTIKSWVISIDQRRDGRGIVRYVEHDGSEVSDTSRRVTSETQVADLVALTGKAGLWKTYPQFFVSVEEDEICIDGNSVIFERLDANGYRYSEANVPCTAGPAQIAVMDKMMELAKRRDLQKLLD